MVADGNNSPIISVIEKSVFMKLDNLDKSRYCLFDRNIPQDMLIT